MPIPTDHLPPAARRLTDRFEFLEELGRGGMAEVYLARPLQGGGPVAVKLVAAPHASDPDAARRFAREARTVAALSHPNLVRTLGVIEAPGGGAVAIVNEYVRGRTLRAILREYGALRFDVAGDILRDLAAGLAHAHAARIVHRDVKPENVFLDDATRRALLADFGIARAIDEDTQLTIAGGSLGTPTYMAPEQVDGRRVDARADVYALGLVGWEMLSGRRPWAGESLYAVLHNQKHESLPDLAALRPDVPAFLLRAIEGALAKDPAQRWRDGSEFLERLTPRARPLDAAPPNPVADAATLRRLTPAAVPPTLEPASAGVAVRGDANVLADTVPEAAAPLMTEVAERREPVPPAHRSAPRRGRRGLLAAAVGVLALLLMVALTRGRGDGERRLPPALDPAAVPMPTTDPAADSATAPTTSAGDVGLENPAPRAPAATPAVTTPPASTPGSTPATTPRTAAPPATPPAAPPVTRRTPEAAPSTPNTPAAPAPLPRGASLAERCRSTNDGDQRACLLEQVENIDVRLTDVYQSLIADYRRAAGGEREPPTVRRLRAEQRLWLVERDRVCRLRTRERSGERWGAARVPCFRELAEQRAAVLEARRPARTAELPRRRVGTGEP